jgi:hypothetical protein
MLLEREMQLVSLSLLTVKVHKMATELIISGAIWATFLIANWIRIEITRSKCEWTRTWTTFMFRQLLSWAENQDNHQNFDPRNLNWWRDFFLDSKMADSKKLSFSILLILNIISWKFQVFDVKGINVAQPGTKYTVVCL